MALLYREDIKKRIGKDKVDALKAVISPSSHEVSSIDIYKFKPLDKDEQWLRKAYFYQARFKELSKKLRSVERVYQEVYGTKHIKIGTGEISKGYGAFEYSIKGGRIAITNLFNDEITYLTP